MQNNFFSLERFTQNFNREMSVAKKIYNQMHYEGLTNNCFIKIDFTFISDKKENLSYLINFLYQHYPYSLDEVKQSGSIFEFSGKTNPIPFTEDNIKYWAIDLYSQGYKFDSELDAYGAVVDQNNQSFPELTPHKLRTYFDNGISCYQNENLSGAIFFLSLVLEIDPLDADAYYNRALIKEELNDKDSALDDYNKSIAQNYSFTDALLNRGALRDDIGDYSGAIEDYLKVLNIKNANLEDQQKAYYNLGNTKYKIGDKKEACKSWKKSFDLGADYAHEHIENFCEDFYN